MFRSSYYLNVLLRMNCRPVSSEYANCWLSPETKMETTLWVRKAAFLRGHKKQNAYGKYLWRRGFIKLQILKTGKRKRFSVSRPCRSFKFSSESCQSLCLKSILQNWTEDKDQKTLIFLFCIKYYSVIKRVVCWEEKYFFLFSHQFLVKLKSILI